MDLPSRGPAADERLMDRDRSAFIRQAIERLPEKQRAAVLMHKFQEMDYNEIAEALGCSESALKSLLFRAYETLRVDLAPLVGVPAASGAGKGVGL
jgi:RNA polymerase sigma-70 factor (ECF subfamily)